MVEKKKHYSGYKSDPDDEECSWQDAYIENRVKLPSDCGRCLV